MKQPPKIEVSLMQQLLQHPRTKPTISLVGNCFLIVVAVYSTFGAFISAFSIPVGTGTLFLIWLLNSVAVSILVMLYRGKGILLLLPPVLLLLVLRIMEIIEGAKWVLHRVSYLFSEWISITVLYPEIREQLESGELVVDPTVFIAAAGMAVTFLLAFAICMRRSLFLTFLFTAPVVFLTFVITDYQADVIYFLGLISVYLTLLISNVLSQDDFFKRGLLFLPAFATALVFMLFVYILTPQGTYVRSYHASILGNNFRHIVSQINRIGNYWHSVPVVGLGQTSWLRLLYVGVWQFDTENVSVADAGGRIITDQSLLEIKTSQPGTFYIRGYSMQHFDGRSWSISDEELTQQYDEISITWDSIFTDIYTSSDSDSSVDMTVGREVMLRNRLEEVQRELVELSSSYSRVIVSIQELEEEFDPELHEHFISMMLPHQDLMLRRRYEEMLETVRWINEELGVYHIARVDIAQSMPAFIAELYATSRANNTPVPVEMEISRTGDLTEGISYRPYYRGVFSEENMISESKEVFYYVEGSVHRLLRYLPSVGAMDVTVDIRVDDYNQNPDEESFFTLDILPEDAFWFSFLSPDAELRALKDVLSEYSGQIQSSGIYTQIDENTALELRQIALDAGIDPTIERALVADAVAEYIMTSGTYTLTPGEVPEDEDFALYFLQDLQEGYCVHFATAAVLMLRSLDIPARFTSGYVATVPNSEVGNRVELTDRNAHAWVEVFYEDVGWLYLEVTPTSEFSVVPSPRPHNPEYQPPNTPLPFRPGLEDEIDIHVDFDPLNPNNGGAASETGGDIVAQGASRLSSWMTNIVRIALCLALCVLALITRRFVLSRYRKQQFRQRKTNEAVIYMWRYVLRMSRHESVPATEIEELALKARFSQHRITEEERKTMINYTQRLAYEIYSGKGGYGRLWFKYFRALY